MGSGSGLNPYWVRIKLELHPRLIIFFKDFKKLLIIDFFFNYPMGPPTLQKAKQKALGIALHCTHNGQGQRLLFFFFCLHIKYFKKLNCNAYVLCPTWVMCMRKTVMHMCCEFVCFSNIIINYWAKSQVKTYWQCLNLALIGLSLDTLTPTPSPTF